jgi:hypothetical protein
MLRVFILGLWLTASVAAQQPADSTPPPCASAEAAQFDF